MTRPSKKEIYNKIRTAKEIVEQATPGNHKIRQINKDVIAMDAIELGYQAGNLKTVLTQLLNEVGIQHYAGEHPPQKSYKQITLNLDLFTFVWKSTRLGCEVYLKFCIDGPIFYLVSLHINRS